MTTNSSLPAKAGNPVTTALSNMTGTNVYWMPRFRGA